MPPPSSATNSIAVNGYSVLSGGTTSGNPRGGYQNEGQTTVTGGTMPFGTNDIVVIQATNVGPNGEFTASSRITGIVVYDNYAQYQAGIPLYTYTSGNNGASIANNTASLGDTYLGFNANNFSSSSPGAPSLGRIFIAAGQNLTSVAAGGSLTIDQFVDVNGPNADGLFSENVEDLLTICVARGTLIDTPTGPRFVETLRVGDLVMTLDDGPQPIRWIGNRKVPADGDLAPVKIRAGVLGNLRDLWVSPNHRMLVSGAEAELLFGSPEVLIAAKHLVDGKRIKITPRRQINYFHFLLDTHHIVFAEGAATESLYPGREALRAVDNEARAEIVRIFPELAKVESIGSLSRPEVTGREARALLRSA